MTAVIVRGEHVAITVYHACPVVERVMGWPAPDLIDGPRRLDDPDLAARWDDQSDADLAAAIGDAWATRSVLVDWGPPARLIADVDTELL